MIPVVALSLTACNGVCFTRVASSRWLNLPDYEFTMEAEPGFALQLALDITYELEPPPQVGFGMFIAGCFLSGYPPVFI
jgi:hypothetical protein